MDVSYWANSSQSWSAILDRARWAHDSGWFGVWVPDHFMPPAGGYSEEASRPGDPELGPVHEAVALQAGLAAAVPDVRIGAMVAGVTYRHPALLANSAATIDHISDGRFVLGIGAGWQVNEHEHYGMELGSPTVRSDRLAEACEVIRSLLDNERTTFRGRYYQLDDAPLEPKPVQEHLPLMIGGGGEQRTLRTVARWADEWNIWATPSGMADKSAVLERRCEEIGRDPAEIRKTVAGLMWVCDDENEAETRRARAGHRCGLIGTVDQLRRILDQYADVGVDELLVPDFMGEVEERLRVFDRFRDEVLAR